MGKEGGTSTFEYSRWDNILINLILGGIIVGCILSQFFGLLQLPFPATASWVMGGIVFFSGILIAVKWTLFWRKEYKGQLVTHGMYKYIRHPHYLSVYLVFFGPPLLFRSIVALLFAALLLLLTPKGLKEEEAHLTKQYGDEYREYMKKVPWKLIPNVY